MHFGNCLPGQMSGEMASPGGWGCTQGALTTDLLTKFLKGKLTSAGEFTREVRQDGSSRQRAWLAQCSSEAGCQSSQVSRWSTGPENHSKRTLVCDPAPVQA